MGEYGGSTQDENHFLLKNLWPKCGVFTYGSSNVWPCLCRVTDTGNLESSNSPLHTYTHNRITIIMFPDYLFNITYRTHFHIHVWRRNTDIDQDEYQKSNCMSDEVSNEYGRKNYILCCRWGEGTLDILIYPKGTHGRIEKYTNSGCRCQEKEYLQH